ncbi:MAG: PEP-CTERM sorting domain-containing protein, partial [Terriglobia bacterium]
GRLSAKLHENARRHIVETFGRELAHIGALLVFVYNGGIFMKRFLWAGAPVVALALCFGTSAFATAELELVSGASTLFITDNGAGDANSANGIVVASTSSFDGWSNVTITGTSNSPSCSGLIGAGCISNVNISATNSGPAGNTLSVYFADSGFSELGYVSTLAASNITNGSVTQTAYNFGGSLSPTDLTSPSGLIGGPLTLSTANTISTFGPSAPGNSNLELETVLTANASTTSQFSLTGTLTPVPEPASGVLLGSLLWGAGLLFRKKMKARNQLAA